MMPSGPVSGAASPGLTNGHFPAVCSQGLFSVPGNSDVSLPVRPRVPSDPGPNLMTSFNLNYLLKGLIFKIQSHWGSGPQHNFGGAQFRPVTLWFVIRNIYLWSLFILSRTEPPRRL